MPVPFIDSHTVVYPIANFLGVPFIPSRTNVWNLHLFEPDLIGVGPGNGGETVLLRLAPNGSSVVATLVAGIGVGTGTMTVTGDTGMPTGKPFVVTIDDEVIFVSRVGAGLYRMRQRAVSNTTAVPHTAGASVTWGDSYDMAVVGQSDLDSVFTADVNSTGTYTYDGWIICFDSSQGYLADGSRYPMHVASFLGVFDAGAGAGGSNRMDAAQPSAVATPEAPTDHCPIGVTNPSRIISFINAGDTALLRYTNPDNVVVDLGPRSVGMQTWYGLGRYDYLPDQADPDYAPDMGNPNAIVIDTDVFAAPDATGDVLQDAWTITPTRTGWTWTPPYDFVALGGGAYEVYTGIAGVGEVGAGPVYDADDWTPEPGTYWRVTYSVRRIQEQAGHWGGSGVGPITNYGIETDNGAGVIFGPKNGSIFGGGGGYAGVTGDPFRPPEHTGDWVDCEAHLYIYGPDADGTTPWYIGFVGTTQPFTGIYPFDAYGYAYEVKDIAMKRVQYPSYSSAVITEPDEPLALAPGIAKDSSDAAGVPIPTSHDVPWLTVTEPADLRFFTLEELRGVPIGALAVRQGKHRIPYWESWDWSDYTYAYCGFGTDCTYAQQLVNVNGLYGYLAQFDYPNLDSADGPDAYWDEADYYFAACWFVCLLVTPYLVGGDSFHGSTPPLPGAGGVPSHPSGGGVTFPPPPPGGHPVIGGSGGGIQPPTSVGLHVWQRSGGF